jgi:single-strand DNA-binding protein
MLNITAFGNLGKDPELNQVGDKQVANFSIAVNHGKEETTWIGCSLWGPRASTFMQYVKKGSKIAVTGRGKLRTYDKKDGTQGQSLELDVNDFTLPVRQQEEEVPF